MSVERYQTDGVLLALVIRSDYDEPGIQFFTDSDSSQQLGHMIRPAGYEVRPHRHNKVERSIELTQEVLFIRRGRCRLDLYGDGTTVLHQLTLETGDVALLAHGGHGLTMLEETQILEVKQGPYGGDMDKTWLFPDPSAS